MAYSVLPIAGVLLTTTTPVEFAYTDGATAVSIPAFGRFMGLRHGSFEFTRIFRLSRVRADHDESFDDTLRDVVRRECLWLGFRRPHRRIFTAYDTTAPAI